MLRTIFLVTFFLLTANSKTTIAAEIKLLEPPGKIAFVSVRGAIVKGDSKKFIDLIKNRRRIIVVLESPGGLVGEALKIGAEIRLRNYATMVTPDRKCFSACGLIWLSGARRYMSQTSKIGFHAAYRKKNGEFRESGVANAEIGSFLTHLGLRIEAIRFITIAGPKNYLLLTPDRARALGIAVLEQNGKVVVSSNDAPTVDIHADRFISYTFMRTRCTELFQPDLGVISQSLKHSFEQGNRLVSPKKWVRLWGPMLDDIKAEITSKGIILLCLEIEAHLRKQRQITGITGPSYDCSKTSTPTERAMCSDKNLWAKDRAMNSIYLYIKKYDNIKVRKAILADQRGWLRVRNACGGDRSCLNRTYDERLRVFKDIDVGN